MDIYIVYFVIVQFILLVPSWFLYRKIFQKIRVQNVKKYTLLSTLLLPILFTWLFVRFNNDYLYDKIRSAPFDPIIWRTQANQRFKMVNDLIDNRLLLNKTKEEILETLGPDSEEGPCGNCVGYSTAEYYQRSFFFTLDHDVFEINFDDQNRVSDVRMNSW